MIKISFVALYIDNRVIQIKTFKFKTGLTPKAYLAKGTWHGESMFVVEPIKIAFVVSGAYHVRYQSGYWLHFSHENIAISV